MMISIISINYSRYYKLISKYFRFKDFNKNWNEKSESQYG